jgi:hypothetical protein
MNISDDKEEGGEEVEKKEMNVETYFFFFLKFISTVIPTMEIDNSFTTTF